MTPPLAALRSISMPVMAALLIAGCSLVFDYESDSSGAPGEGGAVGVGPTTTTGGGAGGEQTSGCNADGECADASPCTEDRCVDGTCRNEALEDGVECQSGGGEDGLCEGGVCVVSCTADDVSVCDDGNPCTADGCNTDIGQCDNVAVPDGPLEGVQTVGDCQAVVCAAGVETTVPDDTDPFDDGNACTEDVCVAGTPQNDNLPEGTSCGSISVCDANGMCVGCNEPSDCDGNDTFCQTITCNAGVCGVSNTPSGTPLPAGQQLANECLLRQCNGGGVAVTVNRANGTSCDDGQYCNGSDSCLSGNCSQHAGSPCAGVGDGDGDCSEACNETNDSCTANDPNGSSCNDGAFCNGADTCLNGSCSQHTGNPCGSVGDGDSDCSEACNETNDSCTANDPNGSSCNDNLYCNGTDSCLNGSCSVHSGSPCGSVGDGDSDCSESCNESTNSCTANDPSGSPCNDGAYCNGTDTCNGSGVCANHSGNPCGPSGTCTGFCNEGANNCSANAPNGMGCAATQGGNICIGECFNGNCFAEPGCGGIPP
ncbi:MAG: hypothetical protein AAF928_06965 [Myxococcota bacterium]